MRARGAASDSRNNARTANTPARPPTQSPTPTRWTASDAVAAGTRSGSRELGHPAGTEAAAAWVPRLPTAIAASARTTAACTLRSTLSGDAARREPHEGRHHADAQDDRDAEKSDEPQADLERGDGAPRRRAVFRQRGVEASVRIDRVGERPRRRMSVDRGDRGPRDRVDPAGARGERDGHRAPIRGIVDGRLVEPGAARVRHPDRPRPGLNRLRKGDGDLGRGGGQVRVRGRIRRDVLGVRGRQLAQAGRGDQDREEREEESLASHGAFGSDRARRQPRATPRTPTIRPRAATTSATVSWPCNAEMMAWASWNWDW